jgi:hypothetical protein
MPSSKPIPELWRLIQSHRVTAVIHVAAKLGIAELLRDGPLSASELADATGADKQALNRLLIALSTIGICSVTGEERYSLTEVGAQLDGNSEQSFKAWAVFEGEVVADRWHGLLDSIMTGKTAAQLQGVTNSFDLMARSPETVSIFNAAMVELTRFATPDILSAYDFGRITHLMASAAALANSSAPSSSNIRICGGRFSIFPGARNPRSIISLVSESVIAPNSCLVISSKLSPKARTRSS